MPDSCSKKYVLPLKVLCSCVIAERRAKELDFEFLNKIGNDKNCPEFNGFNTMMTREQGQTLRPKTQAIYLPLIDMRSTKELSLHERQNIATSHEEADNIIVQQAVMCAKEKSDNVVVVADDTDVFVLLLYHYLQENLTCPLIMSSPIQQRSVIDIKSSVQVHKPIIPGLPAAHALSGCDTVANYFGIGKGTVLKNLVAAPNTLSLLGCLDAQLSDVIDQSTKFIGACYSNKVNEKTMSAIRYKMWATKFDNGAATAPKIQTLPPSTEAFVENVKRAHLQTSIWKSATTLDPPLVNPQEYGYVKDESSTTLVPTTVQTGVTLAPESIMKLIKFNCNGDNPCRTMRCSCNRSKLPCTLFFNCNGTNECLNELTKTVTTSMEEEDQ